jgi:hypothetical protein
VIKYYERNRLKVGIALMQGGGCFYPTLIVDNLSTTQVVDYQVFSLPEEICNLFERKRDYSVKCF